MTKKQKEKKIKIQGVSGIIITYCDKAAYYDKSGTRVPPVMKYINAETGKRYSLLSSAIRSMKTSRYIVLDYCDEDEFPYGVYAHYDRKEELLYLLIMELKENKEKNTFEWKESNRIVIDKRAVTEGPNWKKYLYMSNPDLVEYDELDNWGECIDICGQFNPGATGENIYGQLRTEMLAFTEGPLLAYQDDGSIATIYNVAEHFELMNFLEYFAEIEDTDDDCHNELGLLEINMNGIEFEDRPLRDEIKKKFVDEISSSKKKSLFRQLVSGAVTFSIIDEFNGHYVMQSYFMYVTSGDLKNPENYFFHEYARIGLTKTLNCSLQNLRNQLIWYNKEHIENSPFRYVKDELDELVSMPISSIFSFGMWENKKNRELDVGTVILMAFNPFCEKLCRNSKNAFDLLNRICRLCDNNIESELARIFGIVDYNKEALHQMIGVPKSMLDYALSLYEDNMDMDMLTTIKFIKKLFLHDEKYLQNMSKSQGIELFNCISEMLEDDQEDITKIVSIMVELFGAKRYMEYIKYVDEYSSNYRYGDYYNYIKALAVLAERGVGGKYRWKFKDFGDFDKHKTGILDAANKFKTEVIYSNYTNTFKKLEEQWKQYEYDKDGYIITYPKKPEEIVEEGLALNHCAKEFLKPIADGMTTLLFIRNKTKPKKPYYTLEICNNKIRQCHGINNCTIKKGFKGMNKWLRDFCNEKNVLFSIGDALCAPQD